MSACLTPSVRYRCSASREKAAQPVGGGGWAANEKEELLRAYVCVPKGESLSH
jgi:hypothetical protein